MPRGLRTKLVSVVLVTLAVVATSRTAFAQPMYDTDVLAMNEYRYSANEQYRIGWYCSDTQCGVIHWHWTGSSWSVVGYVISGTVSIFNSPRMEFLGGNLILYDGDDVPHGQSGTWGTSNWLNIQDDGNVVIYDGSNNPLWTPICEVPGQSWYPFGGSCP